MHDTHSPNINLSPDSEVQQHMPRSLQLMVEIEERAAAAVQEILAAVKRGETTLEAEKRKRGLINDS